MIFFIMIFFIMIFVALFVMIVFVMIFVALFVMIVFVMIWFTDTLHVFFMVVIIMMLFVTVLLSLSHVHLLLGFHVSFLAGHSTALRALLFRHCATLAADADVTIIVMADNIDICIVIVRRFIFGRGCFDDLSITCNHLLFLLLFRLDFFKSILRLNAKIASPSQSKVKAGKNGLIQSLPLCVR